MDIDFKLDDKIDIDFEIDDKNLKYRYFILTRRGKFYFNIDKDNRLLFDIDNYKETLKKSYKMYMNVENIEDINNYNLHVSKNFLIACLSDGHYGSPEYFIFDKEKNLQDQIN